MVALTSLQLLLTLSIKVDAAGHTSDWTYLKDRNNQAEGLSIQYQTSADEYDNDETEDNNCFQYDQFLSSIENERVDETNEIYYVSIGSNMAFLDLSADDVTATKQFDFTDLLISGKMANTISVLRQASGYEHIQGLEFYNTSVERLGIYGQSLPFESNEEVLTLIDNYLYLGFGFSSKLSFYTVFNSWNDSFPSSDYCRFGVNINYSGDILFLGTEISTSNYDDRKYIHQVVLYYKMQEPACEESILSTPEGTSPFETSFNVVIGSTTKTINWPEESLLVRSNTNLDCLEYLYTFMQSKDGETQSTLDENLFTVVQNDGVVQMTIFTNDASKAGKYTVFYIVSLLQYPSIEAAQVEAFKFTVVYNCNDATLSIPIGTPFGSPFVVKTFDASKTINWPEVNALVSTSSNADCGEYSYTFMQIKDQESTQNSLDENLITVVDQSRIEIQTNDASHAGEYTVFYTARLANYPTIVSTQTIAFTFTVVDACLDITLSSATDPPFESPFVVRTFDATKTINWPGQEALFSTSSNADCGKYSYTLMKIKDQESTPSPLDESLIAIVDQSRIEIQTNDASHAGEYTVFYTARLANYPTIVSTQTTAFKFTVVDACLDFTLSSATDPPFESPFVVKTFDATKNINWPEEDALVSTSSDADCGEYSYIFMKIKDSESTPSPLDESLIAIVDQTRIEIQTNDVSNAGEYTVFYTARLANYPNIVSTQATAFTFTIVDTCTQSQGLSINSSQPEPIIYYYTGDELSLDTSNMFSTSETNCPITSYDCQQLNSGGSLVPCIFGDPASSDYFSFNYETGIFILKATNIKDGIPPEAYQFNFYSQAGSTTPAIEQVSGLVTVEIKLPCMLQGSDFQWTIATETTEQIPLRDYLDDWENVSYSSFPLKPVVGQTLYQVIGDQDCVIEQPITWFKTKEYNSGSANTINTVQIENLEQTFFLQGRIVGHTLVLKTGIFDFPNLKKVSAQDYDDNLTITRILQFVDAYSILEVDRYNQEESLVDLSSGSTILKLNEPYFKESENSEISFKDPLSPKRSVYLKMMQDGQEIQNPEEFVLVADLDDILTSGEVIRQFDRVATNSVDSFNLVACFSYGDGAYSNLDDLCDEEHPLIVINALGQCYTDFGLEYTEGQLNEWDLQFFDIFINERATEEITIDLASFTFSNLDLSLGCGSDTLGFKLTESSYEEILSVTESGEVTLLAVTDESWIGTHEVQFQAYLLEQGPDASQDLEFTMSINIQKKEVSTIDALYGDRPVPTSTLQSVNSGYFGNITYVEIEFADPVALSIASGQPAEDGQESRVISISVIQDSIAFISVFLIETNDEKIGFGKIVFELDGLAASLEQFDGTENDEQICKAIVEGQFSVLVESVDSDEYKHSRTFEINFEFIQQDTPELDCEQYKTDEEKVVKEEKVEDENEDVPQIEIETKTGSKNDGLTFAGVKIDDYDLEKESEIEDIEEVQLLLIEQTSVSTVGKLTMKFNQDIQRLPINATEPADDKEKEYYESMQNLLSLSSVIDLKIGESSDDEDLDKSIQSYEFLSMTNDTIAIQINFNDSSAISKSILDPDLLQIEILRSDIFITTKKAYQLRALDAFLSLTIEPQLTQIEYKKLQVQAKEAAKLGLGFSIAQIVLFITLNKALKSMWIVINMTQFIVYVSLWIIEFPVDLRLFFSQVKKIAFAEYFDDIGIGSAISEFFGFPSKEDAGPEERVGDERLGSSDILENFGSTLLIALAVFIALVILLTMAICLCRRINLSAKNQERLQKLKRTIFYNPIIKILQLNALKMNLSAMLVIKTFSQTTSTSRIIAIVTIILFNTVPIIFAFTVHKNKDSLGEENTQKKYGTIYAGKNVEADKSDKIWLQPLVYFFRRTIFVIATVMLMKYPSMQMLIHQFLSVATIVYISQDSGMFETKTQKVTEIFSEFMLLVISLFMQECMRYDYSDKTKEALNSGVYTTFTILVGINCLIIFYTAVRHFLNKRRLKKIQKMRQEQHEKNKILREETLKKVLKEKEKREEEVRRKRIQRRKDKKAKKIEKRKALKRAEFERIAEELRQETSEKELFERPLEDPKTGLIDIELMLARARVLLRQDDDINGNKNSPYITTIGSQLEQPTQNSIQKAKKKKKKTKKQSKNNEGKKEAAAQTTKTLTHKEQEAKEQKRLENLRFQSRGGVHQAFPNLGQLNFNSQEIGDIRLDNGSSAFAQNSNYAVAQAVYELNMSAKQRQAEQQQYQQLLNDAERVYEQ